ncbi:MAG: glycosyltransferase [Chloroflexota bacterium]|nr:glycosyltransferase [Chloroflexota bacterium]
MTRDDQRIFVVLPCYNVAGQVAAAIAAVPEWVDGIVAVDDASTDDTACVLAAIRDPRLVVVRHERNRGVGGAVATGFDCAAEQGADILVKVDGDGQMDLDYLPPILDALTKDGYDYAKGNRLLDRKALARMPRVRFVGNLILTFLTKLVSGYWHLLDPQNGFVAIRSTTWALLDRERIFCGYFFENDMLISLNILGARIKDVPMPARYGDEPSSLRVRSIIPLFSWLLLNRTVYRFYMKYVLLDFSPSALFVLAGLPLFFWGFGFGAYSWWVNSQQGTFASTGTVMLSVLPLLVGFQLLLQALVLDIQQSPR